MSNKTILIDLNAPSSVSEEVGVFTLNKAEKKGIFFVSEVSCTYDHVKITNLDIPPSLHLKGDSKEFIRIKSERLGLPPSSLHFNIPIEENGIQFSVIVDIRLISDVVLGTTKHADEEQQIPISFKVEYQCSQYQIFEQEEFNFLLAFKPYKSSIKITNNCSGKILEQMEGKREKIGHIFFTLNKKFSYYFTGDYSAALKLPDDIDQRLIEANFRNVEKSIDEGRQAVVPVYCKLDYIDKQSLPKEIHVDILGKNGKGILFKEDDFSLQILRSTSDMELEVELLNEKIIADSEEYTLTHPVNWKEGERSRMTCFELSLSNTAKSGDGVIRVRNFKLMPSYNTEKIVVEDPDQPLFQYNKAHEVDLRSKENAEHIIKLRFRNDHIQSISSPIDIIMGVEFDYCYTTEQKAQENKIDMLYICRSCIKKGKRTIEVEVQEKCRNCDAPRAHFQIIRPNTDKFGDYLKLYESNKPKLEEHLDWQHFQTLITFTIKEDTGDKWLAIDFGTSASVVAVADLDEMQRKKENSIFINMNEALERLYPQKYDQYSYGEDKSSHLISSEILLRSTINESQRTYLKSDNYQEDVVHISPPVEILKENSHFRLPFLKSLIGFDKLPDINNTFKRLKYCKSKENNAILSFAKRPIEVNEILRSVYNSFLRDFVKPQIGKNHPKKIVISVPNSFTPIQIANIKSIIEQYFTEFEAENICFISESDAVACAYLSDWRGYNQSRPNSDKTLQKDEYVMVFDVGAGTTDITLFKISREEGKGAKYLDVIGKLGKNTAGNYLDYVIASIIDELSPATEKMTKAIGFNEIAYSNKDFIKNIIKPNLNNPEKSFSINPDGSLSDNPVSGTEIFIGQIADHALMKDFLEANSTDIIRQFYTLFHEVDGDINVNEKVGKSIVNTVIFSGRSVLYNKLRNSFLDALNKFIDPKSEPHIIFEKDMDKLKSVVTKGALQYATNFRDKEFSALKITSNNLLARYGFLYKNPVVEQWEFLEIFNPSTESTSLFPTNVSGLNIYEYDSKKYSSQGNGVSITLDLSNTPKGYFVQSYSEDTARDFNAHNFAYITIMYAFSRKSVVTGRNVRKVPVRVQIDEKNQMAVTIGREEKDPSTPLHFDFESNETFKKSLWPYV